jgi:hypothetical protein
MQALSEGAQSQLAFSGPNTEERIRAAFNILSKSNGRTLDLAKLVGSNGASVALMLVHQADVLATQGRGRQ